MEPLKTTKELVAYYQVTPSAIQSWIKEGMPVEMRTGNRNRFKFEGVEKWHAERSEAKKTED